MAVVRQCGFATSVVVPYPFASLGNGSHYTTALRTGHGNAWIWGTDTILLSASEEDDFLVLAGDCQPVGPSDYAFRSDGNSTTHLTLRWDSTNNRWQVYRGTSGGTLLGSTPNGSHAAGFTKFVEFRFLVHDTTGHVQVWLDGVKVLDLTSQDTRNGGTDALIDGIQGVGSNGRWDNLQVINGLGDAPTDRVGPVFVRHGLPSGNGATTTWDGSDGNQTDNYLLVDDPAGVNDGDTTHVETSVAELEQYLIPDISETPVTIIAVDAIMIARDTLAGGNSVRPGYRVNGTNYAGATAVLTGSYAAYGTVWGLSPDTGVAWTRAEYNASELINESL